MSNFSWDSKLAAFDSILTHNTRLCLPGNYEHNNHRVLKSEKNTDMMGFEERLFLHTVFNVPLG